MKFIARNAAQEDQIRSCFIELGNLATNVGVSQDLAVKVHTFATSHIASNIRGVRDGAAFLLSRQQIEWGIDMSSVWLAAVTAELYGPNPTPIGKGELADDILK